jgi:hypothetical protein
VRFPWTPLACLLFPLWFLKRGLLGLRRARERDAWWSEVGPGLWVGGIPFPGDVDALRARGIDAVVSLCAEYLDDEAAYRERGIVFLHVPSIDDLSVPPAKLERAASWIAARVAERRTVYVHCAAGRGRSVATVLAYLVRERGLSTDEALAKVQAARPQAGPTPWQLAAVRRYERELRARAK